MLLMFFWGTRQRRFGVIYLRFGTICRSYLQGSNIPRRMLYRVIIAVCSEIHTQLINTVCEQNVEFVCFMGSVKDMIYVGECSRYVFIRK
jgi:hypothetical protein